LVSPPAFAVALTLIVAVPAWAVVFAVVGAWYLILLLTVSIGVILIEPRGLWGVWRRFFPIEIIPVLHKSSEAVNRTTSEGALRREHGHVPQ
jgi:hypothetical protein